MEAKENEENMESVKEELLLITNNFWQALADRDIEKRFLQCADTITFIGTGLDEKASGKAAYYAINKKGVEQYPEKFKLHILWERASVIEDIGWVENETEWAQMINGKEEKTLIRNTIVLKKTNGKWWIVHVHGSVPDFRLSGQNYITNAETIKINRELESEVYQRTKELQQKNKELEIESSLEKVRTVAMSMRKPDDMLEVCHMISDQLRLLGIREIRNVQTAIVEDRVDGHYMNFQYFTQYDKRIIEDVEIGKHPNVQAMIERMQQSPDAFFSHSFTGMALAEWKQYRRDDNQFPDPILEAAGEVHFYFYSIGQGGLGISAYTPLAENQIALFQRFRNVFTLAYQRFRDIEQAEAQAREAQIEASLERVRARSMAMQKSEELVEASNVLFNELHQLGIEAIRTGIGTVNSEKESVVVWSSQLVENNETKILGEVPRSAHPFFEAYYTAWRNKEPWLTYTMHGEEIIAYYTKMSTLLSYPEKTEFNLTESFNIFFFPEGSLNVITVRTLTQTECRLIQRFANVFGLIYRRFLDLKRAEAQAREAQIELALERVRARTMAMQKSEELSETARVLFQQFKELGEEPIQITIGIVREEENEMEFRVTHWAGGGAKVDQAFSISLNEPTLVHKLYTAWKAQEKYIVVDLTGKELERWLTYRNTISGIATNSADTNGRRVVTAAFFSKGHLSFSTPEPRPSSSIKLLERFAAVFDLTYTRFNDLKLAETQTKEAQIELALERVRARTMAMQKSEELKDVIQVVYEQFAPLHILTEHTGFVMDYKRRDDYHIWVADPLGVPSEIIIPYFDSIYYNRFNEAKENGEDFFATLLTFEEKNAFYQKLFTYIPELPEEAKEFYFSCPGLAASTVLLENIGLYIENFSGIPYTHEENVTLMRFGNVFQQTYTRFLDLQKAEAQTRESQIETALERVRSRTLAMHNSDELAETAAVVFRQLISLGIAPNRLYIAIIHDDNDQMEFWITDEDGTKVSNRFTGSKDKNVSIGKMYDGWTSKQKSITLKMEGKELEDYFHYLSDELHVPFKHGLSQKRRVQNIAYFSKGFIGIASPDDQSEETTRLLERFAAVFNLTYARFNDLKHAEMQTHKAKIEVALERVRARALAMQEPEELVEVAQVMRYEMGLLGVEELETSSIYIHDEGSDIANCWYAIKNIRAPEEKLVADHITMELHQTWVGREMLDFYNSNQQQISIVMKGANRIEWIKYCSGISDVLGDFYGDVIPDRTYHLYKFSNGAIGAASEGDISEESWELLRRATSVFSLAYSRFKDLTQARMDLEKLKTEKQRAEEALAHLKAAQTQLIQSEKMASLGELTAGIAHEIQNPLNFVNNFSDVNTELIEEMKEELASGNMQEAIAIANDIADNEQKINHHGKRADAIVKGMLQHSRSSSGVKEPTDINALAEEYLRLAYHGLRAKDKSFNATMKTDFDPSIGLINIIQQDIGRVILNLITNAFYVVSAKAADLKTPIKEKPATADAVSAPKSPDTSAPWHPIGAKNYTPAVSVRTRLLKSPSGDLGANRVEISVSDNGSGIPQNILDKIFQPFFTTKPTGQGTGLGLSLSYDIVKAHGGELKVQTTEGEGTTFSIQLPIGNP